MEVTSTIVCVLLFETKIHFASLNLLRMFELVIQYIMKFII